MAKYPVPKPKFKQPADNWAWTSKGNCVGIDVNIFYLDDKARGDEKKAQEQAAKKICVGCPVINECLESALAHNELGVWGGTTEDERKKMKRLKIRVKKNA